jgi:transposase-like protein
MNLPTLIVKYGDEDRCRAYLEALRWPEGPVCPRCDSKKVRRMDERKQFACSSCRYHFSVRSGTIFQDSKLALTKWFLAIYIIGESKKGVSAQQLSRMLNVTTKTSWFLCHRIRAAMKDPLPELLDGTVEVDETFVGGVRRGKGRGYIGNKAMVIGAVERDGEVRLRIGKSRDGKALGDFIRDHVAATVDHVYTDGLPAYTRSGIETGKHASVNHEADEWVRGDVHTQTIEGVWSLFKRSIIGSYHHMSVKHLPAYLDEMSFRYNNRDNVYLFRDTLLALIDSENLTYQRLVADRVG